MSDISTQRTAWLLLVGFVAVAGGALWSSAFVLDEWEHLHAAWKLARGETLYLDFFEHHHPPIYLLLAPLVAWWPESVSVILAARGVQLLVALGCVALVHRVGRELEGAAAGRWAAGLWLGFVPVLVTVYKVRPDTPMVLCLFAAVLFGLRALRPGGAGRPGAGGDRSGGPASGAEREFPARDWTLAGASWSVAFLLSSKAVLFLPIMALFPLVVALRVRHRALCADREGAARALWARPRGGPPAVLLRMTAGIVAPLLLGLAGLAATGTLGAFWDWCVRLNSSFVTLRHPGTEAIRSMLTIHPRPVGVALLLGNTLALLLAVAGAVYVHRHGDRRRRTLLLGGTPLALLVVWLAGRGLYWDLLPALLFPAVLAGRGAVLLLERGARWRRRRPGTMARLPAGALGAALCVVLWAQPLMWIVDAGDDSRRLDAARFEHVRDRTGPDDRVHQEWPLFNLHRRDVSFFWFGGPVFVRHASHLGLAEPYDFRALIARTRPAYVSVLRRDEHHRWLTVEAGYRWLEDLQLYERDSLRPR